MPLRPCRHCGFNFMSADLNPDAKNLCNNCQLREPKPKKSEKNMSDEVKIIINFPRKDQIEIEEICINQGINFSDYFLILHRANKNKEILSMQNKLVGSVDLPEEFGKITTVINEGLTDLGNRFTSTIFDHKNKKIEEKNFHHSKKGKK